MKEEWKDIKGFKGRYKISNHGRVMGGRWSRTQILKNRKQKGYDHVTLFDGTKFIGFRIPRLVGLHFVVGHKQGLFINHLDGVKSNNYYKNLEWSTPKENTHHAMRLGLHNFKGERNRGAKLTASKIIWIRELGCTSITQKEIGEKFGIKGDTVGRILRRITWKHI